MKLETPDGRFFSLRVDAYEFPHEELGPTEGNPADEFETGRFVVVSHTFRNTDGEWRASGPIMTTTELQGLIDWLKSIQDRIVLKGGVSFTERVLEFTVDDSQSALRVHVFHGFLPSWVDPAESVTIEFPIASVRFDCVLDSLQRQLARFPGRPPIHDATELC